MAGCCTHSEFITLEDGDKQSLAEKGQPNGYAGLDPNGKVPAAQLDLTAYAKAADVSQDLTDLSTATTTAIASARAAAAADNDALHATIDGEIAASRQAIEHEVAATYVTKVAAGSYVDQTELEAALGPYAKTADIDGTYARKSDLANYIPEAEKGAANGVAALDGNGHINRDALLYKAQGVVEVTQSINYAPQGLQGYVADCTSDQDTEIHIPAVAVAGGAQPGGITPFYKNGLGRLYFTADASITLICDTRYLPEAEAAVGVVVLLTCLTPTKYILTGQRKVAA